MLFKAWIWMLPTALNLAQHRTSAEETFLQNLQHIIFRRCQVLSKPSDLAANATEIFNILGEHQFFFSRQVRNLYHSLRSLVTNLRPLLVFCGHSFSEADSSDTKWLVSHFTSLPLTKWQGCEIGKRWLTSSIAWILWSTCPPSPNCL